jgi:hypothetical protein
MDIRLSATLVALLSVALVGCANMPAEQPLKHEMVGSIQPIEVELAIKQSEVYAAFVPSKAGQAAASGCGAIPGIGLLLAAVCGGAMGAVDAGVNASRGKAADNNVRSLKDEVVDLNFDQMMSAAMKQSLQNVPDLHLNGVQVTKDVSDKTEDQIYRASTAGSVMFVNVDYHISKDYSELQIYANGLVFPRSAQARVAAGQSAEPSAEADSALLDKKNAVYRVSIVYNSSLPVKASSPQEYVSIWTADNARYFRSAVDGGVHEISRLLANDILLGTVAKGSSSEKVDTGDGFKAELLSESDGGELFRSPTGALYFKTTLASRVSVAESVASPAAIPSGSADSVQVRSPAPAVPVTEAMAAPKSTPVVETQPVASLPLPTSAVATDPAPAVATADPQPVASTSSQVSAVSTAGNAMAQDVATQMGCGAVQANGGSTFVAPCGSYSVLIDCDGGQCRPMHTINVKKDD